MSTRRVMLLGATGQVGQACRRLVLPGVELLPLSHLDLDIGDLARVRAVVDQARPSVVINAAAYTAVDRAEADEPTARRVNAQGPANLAVALANQSDARLIHISTDFVFDGRSSTPYATDDATNPLSVYGATKLEGEQAVLAKLGARATVVRTAWVYSSTSNNFVRTMLRLMARGPVRVIADQVGTPTSAISLAEVLWRFVVEDAPGVFHWTDAGVASWYDFAVAIAEEAVNAGLLPAMVDITPIATHEYPTPAKRPPYSLLDKAGTLRRTGIPPVHWRSRLRDVIGELRSA